MGQCQRELAFMPKAHGPEHPETGAENHVMSFKCKANTRKRWGIKLGLAYEVVDKATELPKNSDWTLKNMSLDEKAILNTKSLYSICCI